MTTGKFIALTRQPFVGKVISMLFNMLSMFVIAFLLRSKCLNFMSTVTIHSNLCPSLSPGACSSSCPLSWWCYLTISSPPSLPALNLSQHQSLFTWVSSSYQVAQVLEFQLQHQSSQWIFRTDFLLEGQVGSPCSPMDSQECFSIPQFKSINSWVLSFL